MSDRQVLLATGYSTDVTDLGQERPTGYAELTLYAHVQSESGTSPSLTMELETSADNSTFTKIGSVTKRANDREMAMGLERLPIKRYNRLRFVLGGTSPSYQVTAGFVTGVQQWKAVADSSRQA